MNRQSLTLLALILSFLAPLFAAFCFHQAYQNGSVPLNLTAYGHLLPPGVQIASRYHHKDHWSLIAIHPQECNQRCDLWTQELPQFPKVLSKFDLDVKIIDLTKDNSLLGIQDYIPWDLAASGGVFFVDQRGFIAVAYPFEANVKKAFFDIKKLLVATQ